MQDKYVGDIGDFVKYSLLRALLYDHRLGVSWYLFPDEVNNHGRYREYLKEPAKWCSLDEQTFATLKDVVDRCKRDRCESRISEIERSGLLPDTTVFWNCKLDFDGCTAGSGQCQAEWRNKWFENSLDRLQDCDLVFADPDNGLKKSETFRPGQRKHAKSVSECEARRLAHGGRPVVIYHHNSRFSGGHCAEVLHWQERLGEGTCAVRWRGRSPRTFFILNCTDLLARRAEHWCRRWNKPQVTFQGHVGRQ